jgi:predicted transposase YdaD
MMTEMDRVASLAWAEEKGVMRGRDEGRAEGRTEGIAIGIAQGETIGSLRQAQAIAKKLLAKGMSIADIEDATSLSEPEILALE